MSPYPLLLFFPGATVMLLQAAVAGSLPEPTSRDMGGIGLMATPSARMAETGDIRFNVHHVEPYTRYAFSAQPFSWMEAVYRYTSVANQRYGPEWFSGDQDYKDKSADIKFRLWSESRYLPQLALGFQDMIGTGKFDGEYLVASKRTATPSGVLDFSLGLGWGYLGSRGHFANPLNRLDSDFATRSSGFSGKGGIVEAMRFFRGEEVALFGGATYQPDNSSLQVKLEYDGNNYQQETGGDLQAKSPWNVAVAYRLTKNSRLHLGWERGEQLMAGVSLRLGLAGGEKQLRPRNLQSLPTPEYASTDNPDGAPDWTRVLERLQQDAGYSNAQLWHLNDVVYLRAEQLKFRDRAEAEWHAEQVMVNSLPQGFEHLVIKERRGPFDLYQVRVDKATIDAHDSQQIDTATYDLNHVFSGPTDWRPVLGKPLVDSYSRLNYGIKPELSTVIGGPDSFVLWQLGVSAFGGYWLTEQLELSGGLFTSLAGNYDEYTYDAPSELTRVRTNQREFLTNSDIRMGRLQLAHFAQLSPNWFSQSYGGYLETMYAGAGSELMYHPGNEPWSVAMEVNLVQQRDPSNMFGLGDYRTVTGHLSGFWQTNWQQVGVYMSAGRYLAKDWGTTINLSRSFFNGARIGAYATFTNVSAEQYGEGSFTKGMYISFPLELLSGNRTNSFWSMAYEPLTRDGGQKLMRKHTLYQSLAGRM